MIDLSKEYQTKDGSIVENIVKLKSPCGKIKYTGWVQKNDYWLNFSWDSNGDHFYESKSLIPIPEEISYYFYVYVRSQKNKNRKAFTSGIFPSAEKRDAAARKLSKMSSNYNYHYKIVELCEGKFKNA